MSAHARRFAAPTTFQIRGYILFEVDIPNLADRFEVTEEAMTTRVTTLSFLA